MLLVYMFRFSNNKVSSKRNMNNPHVIWEDPKADHKYN